MSQELGPGDLASLRLFVDTVRLGSLSAAARAQRITQPSASEALRRLERRLGIELVVRTPRGSRPTPDGARLAEHAERVLAELDGFLAEARSLRTAGRRHVRIAASYTNAEYLLPPVIARYRAVRPEVVVSLAVANSAAVITRVAERTADLGFVEDPEPHPDLATRTVATDELVVVVAPGHPWARVTAPLPAAELTGTPLLLREPDSGTRATYERAAHRAGRTVATPLGVMTSTEALKTAVRAGLGATLVSRLAVAAELVAGELAEVPVAGLDLRRELRAVWRPAHAHDLTAEFLAALRS
ncbi:LysR family transcriptional regulator [Actinocatenispora comari]|uniref:LysR family transcriptional regulator n=1 Tax=Actinocatenispora comari TaxID=2807577 RepID=A0A8J4ADA2_9ACTN|nr:LysR family transcriptional regulator [Actinocatenispora comari]GIL28933.1 LysR family transcriptional regulator [Actinocatenispora comari]